MSPFSLGAPFGQSAIGSDALAVKTARMTTSKAGEFRIIQNRLILIDSDITVTGFCSTHLEVIIQPATVRPAIEKIVK
jgi:hypothetical protein